MIRITDKSKCSGCTACHVVCPHGAIHMKPDIMGFLYPEVDMTRCTDCGLCDKVCVFYRQMPRNKEPLAKAARNLDVESLMGSRSGAVFPLLAAEIIGAGGIVYGAAFDDDFRVVHKRAETMEEADSFRGSKYVQSYMADMFKKVRKDLWEGHTVLFSGTPCQVHGLSSYIPDKLKDKLLLVDIVCHGVPSPYVWRDYLEYQRNRLGASISEVSFRDKKSYGWAAHKETYRVAGELYTDTSFTHLFAKDIMLRPSCYACPYAGVHRQSDITLADFWGWQKSVPDINTDDRGVSLVLINSEKGSEMIERCSHALDIRNVELKDCLQPNLCHPSVPDKDYGKFTDDYAKKGLEYVLRRYGNLGWRYKVYSFYMNTKRRIRGWLRK